MKIYNIIKNEFWKSNENFGKVNFICNVGN